MLTEDRILSEALEALASTRQNLSQEQFRRISAETVSEERQKRIEELSERCASLESQLQAERAAFTKTLQATVPSARPEAPSDPGEMIVGPPRKLRASQRLRNLRSAAIQARKEDKRKA